MEQDVLGVTANRGLWPKEGGDHMKKRNFIIKILNRIWFILMTIVFIIIAIKIDTIVR